MSSNPKMNNKPKSQIASKIPTSGRDSGTHSRSSSVSNLTTASDIHSEIGDVTSENVEDFKIEERVWVNGTKPGCIKFLGKTQFAPGVWAGVLLDEAVGKNDGSVAGVKYFSCEPLYGIFARPNKLTRTAGAVSETGDSSLVGFVTPKSKSAIPSSGASVCSNVSSVSTKFLSKLRPGERITVSSLGGLKPGTLRYVGETDFAKGEWAGIELDEPTGKNDGSVAGKRYFTCPMKYGLFAPLHKVSRARTSPLSSSMRGTPLMRSTSRDSLNSSFSNSSRASRVKLGITSLTNAQKARVSGAGVTTTSKALQDALKEKVQHIEELLKERDLDRAELARVTKRFEEMDGKSSELEKKQKKTETDRKGLEEQLNGVQRRLEDIQFQLEEEKIAKSDFEVQLQQRSKILKRLENFILKEPGEKFLNIKEILSGQEALTKISDKQNASSEIENLQNKIAEMEIHLQHLSQEKMDIFNQLTEQQKSSGDSLKKNENLVTTLNTTVQEKEEIITHLKNELNSNIEKVTQLIEDNRNLSEQILLKEEQAKGHADDVIKELGEKVKSLTGELNTKSSQLNDYISSIQEKESKISSLEQSLSTQAVNLIQLQVDLDNISSMFKQKQSELEEKVATQKSLEETIAVLKSQMESGTDEKQKKISLLSEEIKTQSDQINEYLASIQEKESIIASLQQNFDVQATTLSQLQSEHKELTENVKGKDLELEDRAAKQKSLEEQLAILESQSDSNISEKEKKMLDLVKEIESLTNCLQEKEDQLSKAQSELLTSQVKINELNETVKQLSDNVQQANLNQTVTNKEYLEKLDTLQKEVSSLSQEKEQMKVDFEKEIEAFKTGVTVKEEEVQDKISIIAQQESQISLLTEKLKRNEEECSALRNEFAAVSEKNDLLGKEKENVEGSLKEKDECIANFTKQVESLKVLLDKTNHSLEESEKKINLLQESVNMKEEENNQLSSKLQLAEQKVEMLNKDSSDHVMTLQNELSKLKEETTTTKTHLEQELFKVKGEKEHLSESISEKDKALQEKIEILASLETKLKEKEAELLSLNNQKEDFAVILSKSSDSLEAEQKKHQDAFSNIQAEFAAKLEEKEKELVAVKSNVEVLSSSIDQKEKDLLEKENIMTSLQCKLKENESEISNLSTQNAELMKNITKFSSDIEEEQKLHKEKYSSSMMEFENKLKEKEQAINDIQSELQKHTELLETKAKELNEKESKIIALQHLVEERDDQFDDLSEMIESSQKQLVLLKEQNERNEAMLQSKENFINDFKAEQEKQLQLKEQSFKVESEKLTALIKKKDEEIKQKGIKLETVSSNFMLEFSKQKELIESLQSQLEIISAEKKKVADDSSNIYQDLQNQVTKLEMECTKLLEEKEKIAKEEFQTKEAKKSLELVRDSLLQEKSAQEELVKDREAKLAALQAVVDRMQEEFTKHKQELQEKLDISQMELDAVSELKHQLEVQHSVCEELEDGIQASDKKRKELEAQVQIIPVLNEEKKKLQAVVDEFEKIDKDRCEKITGLENKNSTLEEQLNNNKNLLLQKDKELLNLQAQIQKMQEDKLHSTGFNNPSLKSLEEENKSLKIKIGLFELEKSEKSDTSAKPGTKELSAEDDEEKEFLSSQIDFLNSIIVDMKQKNEELTRQLEIQSTCWEESDVNLNETKKAIAPRLFCDICDMFDLHETCDCPKQESFLDEEVPVPQLKRSGSRKLEERPYCNNCEVFGHWTLDCDEPETF